MYNKQVQNTPEKNEELKKLKNERVKLSKFENAFNNETKQKLDFLNNKRDFLRMEINKIDRISPQKNHLKDQLTDLAKARKDYVAEIK